MSSQPRFATLRIDLGPGTPGFEMSYRSGTKDRYTLEENWGKHPYRLARHGDVARRNFIDEEYARIVGAGEAPLIVDAGANIGASVLFFRWRYPAARIIAIEPEPANFDLLRRNTAGQANISVTRSALASADGELRLYDPGRSTDAYRVGAAGAGGLNGDDLGSVPAISVPTLLNGVGRGATPLLAKIDIEGGESDLFSANTDWVDAFPAIAIELHDWMLPGAASSASFLRCVAEKGRDFINPSGTDIVFSLRN
jgi:FkbM family methyltransferase